MKINRAKYKDLERSPEFNLKKEFKEDFFGSSPAPFIGRFGYPDINVGILGTQFSERTGIYDAPKEWSSRNFSINRIAGMRYELVNSRQKANIFSRKGKLIDAVQEIGMASKPVELEVNLENRPKLELKQESEIVPFGPAGKLKKIRITENTRVDNRVDRVVSDSDLKAVAGVWELYKKGFDENFLTKLISVGNLGVGKNRKFVPTRWSITAIDDTLGKQLIEEVKKFPVGDYAVHFGGHLGNYYLVLMFPEIWSYELFENYLDYKVNPWSKGGNFYSTDYEGFNGRKSYAEECAGGYYSVRLSCAEKLKELKRQAGLLVLRFITHDYNIPLGVWVTREASRKALVEKPITFSSKELMLKYAAELIKRKFNFELETLLKESQLLKNMKEQKKLSDF
ncbi:MAG: hypothetical protein ABIA37_03040 [Candidatus Woesearchaeota archaeon]